MWRKGLINDIPLIKNNTFQCLCSAILLRLNQCLIAQLKEQCVKCQCPHSWGSHIKLWWYFNIEKPHTSPLKKNNSFCLHFSFSLLHALSPLIRITGWEFALFMPGGRHDNQPLNLQALPHLWLCDYEGKEEVLVKASTIDCLPGIQVTVTFMSYRW